jgi:hypothetical protein
MKPTLIYVPALLLVSAQVALAADTVPKFDTNRSCSSSIAAAGMTTRNVASCEQDENNARAAIDKEWSQAAPPDKEHCRRLVTVGGPPSYVELLICLEMAQQVKKFDNGKPAETPHAK